MTVTTRQEMHDRIMYLREQMQAGKMFFPVDKKDDYLASFMRVQLAPDGIVDLDTVDARVRAIALAMSAMRAREEVKASVSLADIQHLYFDKIDSAYGSLYQLMLKENSNPNAIAKWVASQDGRLQENVAVARDIAAAIETFWAAAGPASWNHGEDTTATKGVFGGDVFPTDRFNLASCCGIFFDTVIIPDPLKRLHIMLDLQEDRRNVYDFVRFGLKVLAYKDYAVTDLPQPIAAVIPDKMIADEHYSRMIEEQVAADFLAYMRKCFGVDFVDHDEVQAHVQRFTTSQELVAGFVDCTDVVIFADSSADLAQQLDEYRAEFSTHPKFDNAGSAFQILVTGRLYQANDLLRRSSELRGSPVLTAPNSWEWFHRKLRDASVAPGSNLDDVRVAHALRVAAETELSWLGNIPPAALVEMRTSGAIDEIRALLRQSVTSLNDVSVHDFGATADKFIADLQRALVDHKRTIDELTMKRWKFGGLDVASFVVHGGFAVAAALSQSPTLLVAAALYNLAGPTLKIQDVIKRQRDLGRSAKIQSHTPVGMLFNLSRNKTH